jgi:hypothetical protein
MQGDIPLAIYSFEYFAIKEGRLKALIRPITNNPDEYKEGTILNFAGNRFRTSWPQVLDIVALSNEEARAAGFKSGEGLSELGKCKRWLKQIGSDGYLWLYPLEALERESNEPKA